MRLTQSLSYLLLPTLIHAVETNVEAEKNGGRDAVITNLIIQTRKFWHTSKLLQYLKTLKVDWADGLITDFRIQKRIFGTPIKYCNN